MLAFDGGQGGDYQTIIHQQSKQPISFSFVMKLFDRSVDFAQFSEDTPLYALARAWMQNKPYGTKLSDSQDGNLDGDSPSNSQESALSSSSHSVSRKCCCAYVSSSDNNSCFVEDVTTRQ